DPEKQTRLPKMHPKQSNLSTSRGVMRNGLRSPMVVTITALALLRPLHAQDLRITIPKRTQATPVQKLNRDGVKEIQKHHLAKAERLFYKAYLIDPDDPFTLNNLGYISELQGKIERAQR